MEDRPIPAGDLAVAAPPPDRGGTDGVSIGFSAALLMLGTLASRFLGLGRELVAANQFGSGDAMAAFTIADNIQTLLFDLAVSGALQAALIPVLAQTMGLGREEMRRAGGALLTVVLLVSGVVAAVVIAYAPAVVAVMTTAGGDGAARDQATVALTVDLVRIVMPATVLLGAATVGMAMLHAAGRVAAPSFGIAARNAAVVAVVLVGGQSLGVRGLAWGTVLGALVLALFQVPPLVRAGLLPTPNWGFDEPALREAGRLYLPVFLGLSVTAAGTVIDRNLAWGAGEHALGAMRYATTLVQLILGLVAAAVGLAALPTMARAFAAKDEAAFATTFTAALRLVCLLIVPATLGLAAISVPAVGLLFQHGATGEDGARATVVATVAYLPGTACAALAQLLTFAAYARGNTWLPVGAGIVATVISVGVALALVGPLGMLGLVLANSTLFAVQAALLWGLRRRTFPLGIGDLGDSPARSLVAGTVCAAMALGAWQALVRLGIGDGGGLGAETLLVVAPVVVGTVVYGSMLRRFGRDDLAVLGSLVRRRAAVAG